MATQKIVNLVNDTDSESLKFLNDLNKLIKNLIILKIS